MAMKATRSENPQTDGKPPEPKEPELDNASKAQKFLEIYWQILSGQEIRSTHTVSLLTSLY